MAENLLRRTLVALADAKVRFVVCGGVACVLQGVARTTHDLDVRVALESPDLEALVRVARELGLGPRIPEPLESLLDPERRRAWVEEKHAVVYTLIAPSGAFSLDVFLDYPLSFDELAAEADRFDIEGRRVLVSSKRHLILAKSSVTPPRKVDLRDIEDLEELLRGPR
ncbi:MAG: hypothetical protein FJ102_20295 [Deltaproteobacteria bacterium]|nr:hypothetical protein [Deltaproteobacteria bacterium]